LKAKVETSISHFSFKLLVPGGFTLGLNLKAEVETSISHFGFKAPSSRRFHLEFDRVNLHCPAMSLPTLRLPNLKVDWHMTAAPATKV
jgi:hypothetical protein